MAVSGMTGFARVEGSHGDWSWAVEARSVNGRNLETRLKAPAGFDTLERVARDGAQKRFARGNVQVSVQAKRGERETETRINFEELERLLNLAHGYAAEGRAAQPQVEGLLALRGVMVAAEDDEDLELRASVETAIAASVETALDQLREARLAEGAALLPVLAGLVDRIEALARRAAEDARDQPALIKERFTRRMAELIGERAAGLEERIVQEAAVLAVRADVREELDRLSAHIDSARRLLAEDAAVGRRLDFLSQEFMRETNTLCSKSATTTLTAVGLEMKAAVEQFREQIQNVE